MDQLVACPDCGTSNRSDADLCAQCWRELRDDAVSKIPAAAFSVAPARPATLVPPPPTSPPPPAAAPRPRPAPEPVTPREAQPGPIPYFAPVTVSVPAVNSGPIDASPPLTAAKAPWGMLAVIALVLAVVGGGYFFLTGRSSAAFSPEDGSYSVVLPEGWQVLEESEAQGMPGQIDTVVESETGDSGIFVGHWPVPGGVTAEQFRAGMGFAQQFMPRFPGVTMGSFQESSAVAAEGVTAFEMTASVNGGLVPQGRGKMRVVIAIRDGAPSFVLMMVACSETECATVEPVFQEMAGTLEISD